MVGRRSPGSAHFGEATIQAGAPALGERPVRTTTFSRMRAAMSVPGAASDWTYSEYARLPDDGNRYEVIDGEVCVTPSPGPKHQRVAANLFRVLAEYVEREQLGEMLWDLDLLFVTGQFLRPDMLFVPRD